MRIRHIEHQPFHRVRYLNAGRRGRTVSSVLQVHRGRVDSLPEGIDALIVASDLQGVVPNAWRAGGANVLLGVELAREMVALSEDGEMPYPERTGVVLAGDLYSAPGGDVRGATGDVREVWLAWAEHHRWVCGVQGNHDLFGDKRDRARFERTDDLHLLDAEVRVLDGLRMGGVGKIIGDPTKKGRKSEDDFLTELTLVAEAAPHVLVLHQGPDASRRQRGDERVRNVLERRAPRAEPFLAICGHVHWEQPLAESKWGQVLNVDARAVVLTT